MRAFFPAADAKIARVARHVLYDFLEELGKNNRRRQTKYTNDREKEEKKEFCTAYSSRFSS
jgi:hypothetical protein